MMSRISAAVAGRRRADDGRTAPAPATGLPMSEKDLRRAILCERGSELVQGQLASRCPGDCIVHLLGWHGTYATPLQTRRGWATPLRGDWGKGWPDLMLVSPRRGRLLFAELKSTAGDLDPEQRAVLHGLYVAGLEVHIWRPADLDSGIIWHILAASSAIPCSIAELEAIGQLERVP